MLTSMREMLRSKWVGGIVFGLVIVAMAFWIDDPGSLLRGWQSGIITAGDRSVSAEQIDRRVESYIRNYQQETGEALTREEAAEQGVVDQLFAREMSRTARLGFADKIGATASTAGVLEALREIEAFEDPVTGRFSMAQYREALDRARISNAEFERDLRDDLTLTALEGATTAILETPDIYGRIEAAYMSEFRTVSWFAFSESDLPENTEPSEEDLKAFYFQNLERFQYPERRAINILSLSPDDYLHQAPVPEEDVTAYYEAVKAQRFSNSETRSFVEAAFETEAAAQRALGQLAGGADVDTVGAVYVNERSGLQEEVADKDLAERLYSPFALEGSVFGPTQRGEGWIVTRLNSITPGDPFPIEDVADIIRADLAEQRAKQLFFDATTQIDNLIGAGASLETMGEELGTPVFSYPPIDKNGISVSGVNFTVPLPQASPYQQPLRMPELREQAFLFQEGELLDPIEGQDSLIMAAVGEIVPAETPPFEDIRETVEAAYAAQSSADRLDTALADIETRIATGETTLEEEAAALEVLVNSPVEGVSRQNFDIGLPRAAAGSVFSAKPGEVFTAFGSTPEERLVVRLESIDRAAEDELEILAPAAALRLRAAIANDIQQAFETAVREESGLKTDAAGFAAYKASLSQQ